MIYETCTVTYEYDTSTVKESALIYEVSLPLLKQQEGDSCKSRSNEQENRDEAYTL